LSVTAGLKRNPAGSKIDIKTEIEGEEYARV
jgi:hypothetical protein